MSVAWVGVGASVLGSVMGSNAASDAADQQAQSGRDSMALQKDMFDKTNALQEPIRQNGLNASNRLQQLMGLSSGASPAGMPGASGGLTAEQLRAQLLSQYTTTEAPNPALGMNWTRDNDTTTWTPQTGAQTIDEDGLQAAIQARMGQQGQPAQQGQSNDPAFGSLSRNFAASDLAADPLYQQQSGLVQSALARAANFETAPGYEFRKAEGEKGVENSAAARGGLLSGAAMKAMQKYGQDFASNEYNNWFSQSNADRNYVSAQGDAASNRFNANNTTQFNRLSGMAGSGQTAATQQGTAATQYGQSAGSTITGIGNAQAAGTVGSANAWSNGIGGAVNNYQSNQLMDMIRNPGGSASAWSPVSDGGYSVGQGSAYGGNRRGM